MGLGLVLFCFVSPAFPDYSLKNMGNCIDKVSIEELELRLSFEGQNANLVPKVFIFVLFWPGQGSVLG